MNRRSFLRMLSAVPVGAVLAENPLARSIFLPPVGGWFSNVLSPASALSEQSLEDILIEIQKHPGPLVINPTMISGRDFRMIVEPQITKIFAEAFDRHPGDWEGIFNDTQEGSADVRDSGFPRYPIYLDRVTERGNPLVNESHVGAYEEVAGERRRWSPFSFFRRGE